MHPAIKTMPRKGLEGEACIVATLVKGECLWVVTKHGGQAQSSKRNLEQRVDFRVVRMFVCFFRTALYGGFVQVGGVPGQMWGLRIG